MSEGAELIGEYENSGFKEQVYLARRADGQVIQLSHLLYLVATEADGQKDFEQIALRVSKEFGRTVSADNIRFLVEKKLRPLGVLAAADGSSPNELERAKPMFALRFRMPILPEGKVLRAITGVFRPLFLPPVIFMMLAGLVALDIWLFFIHGFGQSVRDFIYQPALFLMVVGLTYLSMFFHEVGHATACRYGGAKPGCIGVGIYFVWPVAYNDVTDTYRLGRVGRLRTDLGGVYFNGLFSLALGGVYFLTGFEPLLLIIFLQHLLILYQFMPFLRLDGYYVVSDLTGVPDLFSRIKPILRSLIPGKGMDRRVETLKPWVRVVVSGWVLALIPTLLFIFTRLIMNAPLIYAAAWGSFLLHYKKSWDAFGDGEVIGGVASVVQVVLLVIPVAGITLMFALVGKRLLLLGARLVLLLGSTLWRGRT